MAEIKTLSKQRARSILQAASKKVVLVTGDAMLDQFIWGEVDRISPEAPVPIVNFKKESFMAEELRTLLEILRLFTVQHRCTV